MLEPFAIISVAEMRDLEAAAVAAGTPERVLQERAGLGVADVVEAELARLGLTRPVSRAPRVLVLAGSGNNGRDGVVAARRLLSRGCQVQVWLAARNPLSETEARDLVAEGAALVPVDGNLDALAQAVQGADVVIDALLGVGSRGALRSDMAAVAGVANAASGPGLLEGEMPLVVAVDMPTGVDADSGAVDGMAITADITVTYGAVKSGLLKFPAAGYVGRLVPCSIGLPAGSAAQHPVHVLDENVVRPLVPPRPPDSHKYRLGRVMVIAGSDQYVGAACMASEAAARAGAGLVGLVSTEAVKRVLATRLPEATYPLTLPVLDERPGQSAQQSADQVAALLPEQAVLLIGPGIGRSHETERFLRRLLSANAAYATPTPAVIDADALSLLAQWPHWWEQIGEGHVLTPHAGEMARLLDSDGGVPNIADEAPWDTARRAAERWKQVVVLKGPFTTVAEPGGRAWVYPHANPALATAGTGDVLAGLTAGLAAQGLESVDAARLGVVVHALAGRRASEGRSRRTIVASDLPGEIPFILAELASGGRAMTSGTCARQTPDDLRR